MVSEPNAPHREPRREQKKARERRMVTVASLESLLGAHPDALRDLFLEAEPTDPTAFAGDVRGLFLAIEPLADIHVLTRPMVKLVAGRLLPWEGISFESGGTAGVNRMLGRRMFRFRCEVAPSELDGKPALVMAYDGLGNRWPISQLVDELRTVGDGIAIGPTFLRTARGLQLLSWWGIAAHQL